MITLANALTTALAHLQAQGAGHKITVPLAAWEQQHCTPEGWCLRNGIKGTWNGREMVLEIDAGEVGE
jgi:hypothetical protein